MVFLQKQNKHDANMERVCNSKAVFTERNII